jgi:hypothetical protein
MVFVSDMVVVDLDGERVVVGVVDLGVEVVVVVIRVRCV